MKVAKVVMMAGDIVLKVQTRVDENSLRRQAANILPELAKMIRERKAQLAL